MAKVRFELNWAGVGELLKGPEMIGVLTEYAERTRSEYGPEAEVSAYVGPNRANVSVYQPASETTNNLLKALGRAKDG